MLHKHFPLTKPKHINTINQSWWADLRTIRGRTLSNLFDFQGSIFSAIGGAIEAVISAIAGVIMTIVGVITMVRDTFPPIVRIADWYMVSADHCHNCWRYRRHHLLSLLWSTQKLKAKREIILRSLPIPSLDQTDLTSDTYPIFSSNDTPLCDVFLFPIAFSFGSSWRESSILFPGMPLSYAIQYIPVCSHFWSVNRFLASLS